MPNGFSKDFRQIEHNALSQINHAFSKLSEIDICERQNTSLIKGI